MHVLQNTFARTVIATGVTRLSHGDDARAWNNSASSALLVCPDPVKFVSLMEQNKENGKQYVFRQADLVKILAFPFRFRV
jgi:hypothetical protein